MQQSHLATLRKRAGLSQEELAAKLNISQSAVYGFESRDKVPVSRVEEMAEALGLDKRAGSTLLHLISGRLPYLLPVDWTGVEPEVLHRLWCDFIGSIRFSAEQNHARGYWRQV